MNIRELSPELAKKAQVIGENSDTLENDINELRSWIEEQPHLISRKDDQFLLTFLRRCNFNLDESKKRIEAFLTCKTNYPDLYKDRAVDETALDILKCGLVTIPPNSLPDNGPRLLITQVSKFDPKKHSLRDVMKVRFMLFEILTFEDDITSISGLELVFDLQDCSLKQALGLNPALLRKTYIYQDECIPLNIKHFHIINMKKELQGVVNLARSMISTGTGFDIVIHEKESDLYKYIPQESMPVEYGGQNGTHEKFLEEWEKILLDHVEYFEEDSFLGTNLENSSCCIS
ncbi:alpha-tocopherol transfer protein-like [Episyrphus balteatus]|uniref:alpha-tocopherol transfer protein-like n=1 Tax=Episyrphus balteatus TaxID=286459 RepID=UPI002484E319|nr:alpha-tocopherol transfer protein-like [Episyrphus balteatus]